MISRFFVHVFIYDAVECYVSGWRDTAEKCVHIQRIQIDGVTLNEEARDNLLKRTTGIYRELERKLGYPRYSLKYVEPRNYYVFSI